MNKEVRDILRENKRRNDEVFATFNPYTGQGSVGERFVFELPDFPYPKQWLPVTLKNIPLVKKLKKAGSIKAFIINLYKEKGIDLSSVHNDSAVELIQQERLKVIDAFVRIRIKHDFPFWAALFGTIKPKGGGDDIPFRLTRPQRRFVAKLEKMRLAGKPIRIILLKARQWGGSTTSQLYMAWLQLVHKVGLNSLIIAHQGAGSDEINDMFNRMITHYPIEMLHQIGDAFQQNEPKFVGVGKSGAIHRVPQRNCKIKIGTAERPDSCRGGDYNLVHLSEVGIWKTTDGKKPEDIVQAACSGIRLAPYTMIVYESTAKGSDNFFHHEYIAAKNNKSQFQAMFISWFDIEWNIIPITATTLPLALQPSVHSGSAAGLSPIEQFATWLYENREQEDAPSTREDAGKYIWSLWQRGATLEAINWYIQERAGKPAHEIMCSENPTDDIEAFTFTGANVFDRYLVEELRATCRPPKYVGEVASVHGTSGEDCLKDVHFTNDTRGRLAVWSLPETTNEEEIVTDRYITVVDPGKGRTAKADYSVVLVLDREGMLDMDGNPTVVAQWYGHIDKDLLAWKAAQIAKFYNTALLVVESNTHETGADERGTDYAGFILNEIGDTYPNMYKRHADAENIREGRATKYGFHTNTKTKPIIIEGLKNCVRDKLWTERDESALEEFLTYIQNDRGVMEASSGCHDDKLMARAIGLHICYHEMPRPKIIKRQDKLLKKRKSIPISAASM